MSKLEKQLNKKCNSLLKKIEREHNKNTVPFGDLLPGNLYHVPTILSLGSGVTSKRKLDKEILKHVPTTSGHIKDIQYKQEHLEIKTFRVLIGYSYASRITYGDVKPELALRAVLIDVLLRIKKEQGFDSSIPNTGDYYIKFGKFEECANNAVFQLEVESCCVPNIDLKLLKELNK